MVDPLKSGIYTLPLMLSLVFSSILSGVFTQKIGYYVPSALLAPSIMSVGQGLMSTFTPDTGSPQWIGFQFLAGFGLGLGMQIGNLAAQTVLPPADISTGVAIMFFVQQLGGAIFTTVGQALLDNLLSTRLADIPGIDPKSIVNVGTTELVKNVSPDYLHRVIDAYNYASTRVFLTGMGLAMLALISAFFLEWKSIKKGKHVPPGAGGPGGPPGGPGAGGPPMMGPGAGPGAGGPMMPGSAGKSEAEIHTTVSNFSRPSMTQSYTMSQDGTAPSMSVTRTSSRPEIDPKFVKAQKEAEERLRRARRESDPSFRREGSRLVKKSNRHSVSVCQNCGHVDGQPVEQWHEKY